MHNQGTIEEFLARLKIRYSNKTPILDLILLIEMLREENIVLKAAKTDDQEVRK